MKHLFFPVAILLYSTNSLYGQPEAMDNEWNASLGTYPTIDMASGVLRPVAQLKYAYYLSERFTVGVVATGHITTYKYQEGPDKVKSDGLVLTAGVEAKKVLINTDGFQLYWASGFAVQASRPPYLYNNNLHYTAGLQLTPLGVRIGRINALFFEMGYGYKGTFSIGYSRLVCHK